MISMLQFDENGMLIIPALLQLDLDKAKLLKDNTDKIKVIYDECLILVLKKYKIKVPELKVKNVTPSYVPIDNVIRILPSLADNAEECKKTILHEFCHAIEHQIFNGHSKNSVHDKKFYELCIEFGLPYEHDSITGKEKKQAYNEMKGGVENDKEGRETSNQAC